MFTKKFVSSVIRTAGIYDFINADLHSVFPVSKWFSDGEYFSIYLRNKYIYIPITKSDLNSPHIKHSAIAIASISIDEEFQRQGLGSNLITTIHESHNKDMTFVELVHNPHLEKWLKKNYWLVYNEDDPTYFKINFNCNEDTVDVDFS